MDRLTDGEVIAKLARGFLLAGVKQKILRIGEVVCHKTGGECGVSLFDRVQDRLMELQGVLQFDQLRGHHDHIQHGAMDGLKESSGESIA
jgi:hypothetical protein